MSIHATLKCNWEMPDADRKANRSGRAIVPKGRYELERILNPFGHPASWLVLKGTKIGATEGFWKQWAEPEFGEFQIIMEYDEEVKNVPA